MIKTGKIPITAMAILMPVDGIAVASMFIPWLALLMRNCVSRSILFKRTWMLYNVSLFI